MNYFKMVIGSILVSIGLFFLIIYLNLFAMGYTFWKFVYFIIRNGILFIILLGIFIIKKGIGRIK